MPQARMTLAAVATALDGLSIAFYALDQADCTICWNRTFMNFFPEHAGKMETGESYADNLRRFYAKRLEPAELPLLETYVGEGLVRNREQRSPYAFEHGKRRLLVSSLALPNVGRVRIWRDVTEQRDTEWIRTSLPSRFRGALSDDGLRMLESMADGVSILDAGGRIAWTNGPFGVMYDLPDNTRVVGSTFADLYRAAWEPVRETDAGGRDYERGALVLLEHLRFAGAPFELPLPGGRWVRVLHHEGTDGMTYMAHVDITRIKAERASYEAATRQPGGDALYRALAAHSFDVVVCVNAGAIEFVSPSVEALFGIRPEQLVGQTARSPVEAGAVQALRDHLLHEAPEVHTRLPRPGGGSVRIETRRKTLPPVVGDAAQRTLLNLRAAD